MRILPVIDLLDGNVVRGVAGRRETYQPIVSQIADDAQPGTVARAIVETHELRHAYVADLSALSGARPDVQSYAQIQDAGMRMMIDAGIGNQQQAEQMQTNYGGWATEGWIVALESLDEFASLHEIRQRLATPVFSLDLKHGELLNNKLPWRHYHAIQMVERALEAGFQRVIVLDLAAVGMGRGPVTLNLCRQIRRLAPNVELISGGGVQSRSDLDALENAGCNAALVASALHANRASFVPPARSG